MLRLAILASLLAFACKDEPKGTTKPPPKPVEACAGKGEVKGPLTWFEDDYAGALACAKQKNLPIVIDLWAPWCHTCIAMQENVFTDASFEKVKDKFVFLALDTDREANAAAVGKLAPSAMPTFYVIDIDESVLARFVGAATLLQFQSFLGSADMAKKGNLAKGDARLLGAERALARKDYVTAEEELEAALAAGPVAWSRRAEVLWSLQMVKKKRDNIAGCLDVSDTYMDHVGQTAVATNFWNQAIKCAKAPAAATLPKAMPVFERAVGKLQKVLDDPAAPLSADDRAEALGYLRDGLVGLKKDKESKAAAEKLRVFLDDAWVKAPTPIARMAFLWPRAEAYAHLGRGLELVADFEKLAAELPKEYEPSARLGWIYLKSGKPAEAASWTDKALALVYGPRKARILSQRAAIAALAGDRATERRFLQEVIALWQSLPPEQQSPAGRAAAEKALADHDASVSSAGSAAVQAGSAGPAVGSGGRGSAK
jgi:thiol-disulfide isomerase/thioredoxin